MNDVTQEIIDLRHHISLIEADLDIHRKTISGLMTMITTVSTDSTNSTVEINKGLAEFFPKYHKTIQENSDHVVNIYHMIAEIFDKLLPVFHKTFPDVRDTEKQIAAILKRRPS